MDKPTLTGAAADRLIASEQAIEKAFADAAFAMFGFGQPRRGAQAPAPSAAPSLALDDIRRALATARWGAA
ncbi:MAG: hypothetical protein B7Y99_01330 [Caulobacterales bacterium 32-69-10]|nr:MAG: hypothetical protein B7Y99_01330 [Caulobacterales bacterium 32-69-10]